MKICMIGTGYVGLVTGACFAEMGNDVICIDENAEKIRMLKEGIVPIYEPGLKEVIDRNVQGDRLRFTTDFEEGVSRCQICFIAVGTPQDKDGSADLRYVLQVARQIGGLMDGYKIIVDKSTVPVGTADKVREVVKEELEKRGLQHIEFDVVSNPEFLKEGNALQDFMRPERVIVGTDNVRTAALFRELYDPFVRTTNNPILIMDIRSAELTKYASNAFLATKVTFMNELAILCDKVGADISQVREGGRTVLGLRRFHSALPATFSELSKVWGVSPGLGRLCTLVPTGISALQPFSRLKARSTLADTPGLGSYPISFASSRMDLRSVAVRRYPSLAILSW